MKFLTLILTFTICAGLFAKEEVRAKKETKVTKELPDFDTKLARKLHKEEGAILLDVRTLIEYKFSNIPNSKRIHVGDLDEEIGQVKKWVKNDLDHPIIVFCAAGIRAKRAKKILKKHGFTRVMNLGGISDWEK